jgi:two-component system NtrC family sensor kinase
MSILGDMPLKRRLLVTSLVANGVALLLASLAFVTYELYTLEDSMVADLSGAAAIIGHNSSAALAFADPDSAAQTLQSFSTNPHVVGAALYDRDGQLFAQYASAAIEAPFEAPAIEPPGHRFESDRLKLFHEFELAGEPAGTVYIESDVDRLAARVSRYAAIGLFVMLVSVGVAFMLSAKLQHAVSGRISELATAMNVVRARNDYSVRVTKRGKDELGALIEGFNAMLDQIQAQDRALQEARESLERRVEERTKELQQEIAERKSAQAQVEQIHGQLVGASRRAGMAEVATNVLHNVGNVLNSVNVSASVLEEQVEQSQVVNLSRLAGLLAEREQDLGTFLTTDPRGKQIPAYLKKLAEQLLTERGNSLSELKTLRGKIEHIKRVVTMQQSYAKVAGVEETTRVADLLEDALRMSSTSLQRHGVEVIREYGDVPELSTDKHKILQILVNLVRNAKDACAASGRPDKRITLRLANDDERIKISVADNGVGIAPENMTKIFAHGFTTKQDGHGFGLHGGALAAQELGGSLTVASGGPDRGAMFTLELPLAVAQRADVGEGQRGVRAG